MDVGASARPYGLATPATSGSRVPPPLGAAFTVPLASVKYTFMVSTASWTGLEPTTIPVARHVPKEQKLPWQSCPQTPQFLGSDSRCVHTPAHSTERQPPPSSPASTTGRTQTSNALHFSPPLHALLAQQLCPPPPQGGAPVSAPESARPASWNVPPPWAHPTSHANVTQVRRLMRLSVRLAQDVPAEVAWRKAITTYARACVSAARAPANSATGAVQIGSTPQPTASAARTPGKMPIDIATFARSRASRASEKARAAPSATETSAAPSAASSVDG